MKHLGDWRRRVPQPGVVNMGAAREELSAEDAQLALLVHLLQPRDRPTMAAVPVVGPRTLFVRGLVIPLVFAPSFAPAHQ